MGHFKTLLAYTKAFELAMEIFQLSKCFPPEEKYSLTDQIRRSSRSVCNNIGEAYRRRTYKNYYLSKLNDSLTENTETEIWLSFSLACTYLNKGDFNYLSGKNEEVGRLLVYMMNNPDKYS